MAVVQNLESLNKKLDALLAKYTVDGEPTVIVGYTAEYAVYVHEDLTKNHPNGKAKFLEDPARNNANEIGDIITEAMVNGKTPAQALLLGGLFLQAESQKECPVDTGNLKGSAFTRLEIHA